MWDMTKNRPLVVATDATLTNGDVRALVERELAFCTIKPAGDKSHDQARFLRPLDSD
jgi:hypothetical protein